MAQCELNSGPYYDGSALRMVVHLVLGPKHVRMGPTAEFKLLNKPFLRALPLEFKIYASSIQKYPKI